jgi:hypothetical protein
MRTLLWARRSLSTSATSFQLLRHTSTLPRALSSPDAGDCPANVATHDALFTLLSPSSFVCKDGLSSMRRSELRVFPDTRPREPDPEGPLSLHPHQRHLSGGPAGHGKRAGRKSGAKVNRISLARKTDPGEAYASRSLLDCSLEPLLSLAMRARWDGGPFACFYTSASPAKTFVPIVLPRRITPFRKPRGLSPWESNDGRDRSLGHSTGPLRYATVTYGFATERDRAFVLPKVLAWG